MISIRHLEKTFNRGKANAIRVIRDVSLDLPAAGMVAIFGRSGCGKTTLLNVIGGLDRTESGSVEIDGERMTVSSDALRNRSVGYIFQNYCLNREKTCRENVADALRLLGVSDRAEIGEQVDAALRAVGMERFASRMPDTLSGGQQQRIAIARAIVKNPPVILADEPTGNLDEQNTLHVMRLLKAISRDRLVLLVTHEENLVSAFSDRVIELSDGQIVSDRQNVPTEGFTARDKNAVYLGELPHETLLDGKSGVTLDLYGKAPGVKLRLVRAKDGRVFLKIDEGKVNVLDESSEVRLENGTAPEKNEAGRKDDLPDLSQIKPIKGTRFGRLFGFADAWKSGLRANLGKQRRGRKLLRNALILFAAVVVFMTASLGIFIRNLADVDASYHHHIVYAYAGDETAAAALSAIGAEAGVTYRQILLSGPASGDAFTFNAGDFETFTGRGSSNRYSRRLGGATVDSTGVALLRSTAASRTLLAGRNEDLAFDDALVSEGFARALLKSATVDYLKDYDDLIGLTSQDGGYRIAGVVSGDDRELFLPIRALMEYDSFSEAQVNVPSPYGVVAAPADGKTTIVLPYEPAAPTRIPAAGDSVLINGKTFVVDRVIRGFNETYAAWCAERGYLLPDAPSGFDFAASEEYLAHYREYLSDKSDVFGYPDFPTLLSFLPAGEDALYWTDPGDPAVKTALYPLAYRALWREAHPGEANPTEEQVQLWAEEAGDAAYTLYKARLEELPNLYPEQYQFFYSLMTSRSYQPFGYLLNEREAEEAYSRVGKTTLLESTYDYYDEKTFEAGEEHIAKRTYLALLTDDPEKTAAAIEAALGDHYRALKEEENGFIDDRDAALYTPAGFRRDALDLYRGDIVSNAIELAVFLSVMSLCMYLMMRASTIGRIREIGIYRAIGVSKKNLLFRFFVESLAVASCTVFIGYLFSSLLISAWLAKVPLIGDLFYYPLPLALASLALLIGVSALCGTLPVMKLLRKTPSEILSKYDI